MGRTQRRRKIKKSYNFQTCSDSRDLILFNKWLAEMGIERSKKLVLASFSDYGRGVLTKTRIRTGEELINLPLNLTINVTTLLMDEEFCSIFEGSLLEYKHSVSFQSLLAFYLLFLKVQGERSKWHLYLKSLPKDYTVPYFLPNEIKHCLEPSILIVVEKQIDIIDTAFCIFHEILNYSKSHFQSVKDLKIYYNKTNFEWAYFTVNTRCVFIDLTKLININQTESTILYLINDSSKISLCPFLDMINHSAKAQNETKLIVENKVKNVSLFALCEDAFSKVRFSICTKTRFEAYSQVFICYGDSHNLKLITEYGFCLPSNSLDYIPLQFEKFMSFLHSQKVNLSQEQCSFIMKHGLDKDLYIDIRGLSFHLYGLLIVVKYFYAKDVNMSKLLYSAAMCTYDRVLIDFIRPILYKKFIDTEIILKTMKNFEKSVTLNNCIELVSQYIRILERNINNLT